MNEKNNSLLVYTLIYFGFLYIPVLFLPIFSFNDANYMSFPLAGFTTDHYEEMWSKRNLHKALWASVKVGVVASVEVQQLHFSLQRHLLDINLGDRMFLTEQ